MLLLLTTRFASAADLRSLTTLKENKQQVQMLAETKAEIDSKAVIEQVAGDFKPIYKTDDPHGIALMMLGLFLIPFSQVLLWKNEKKAVTFAELIVRARKACISVDHEKPNEYNDYSLVHVTGKTNNSEDLCD